MDPKGIRIEYSLRDYEIEPVMQSARLMFEYDRDNFRVEVAANGVRRKRRGGDPSKEGVKRVSPDDPIESMARRMGLDSARRARLTSIAYELSRRIAEAEG